MVYAGGDVDRSVAFMQCNKTALMAWAKSAGITDVPFERLINDPRARKAVLDDLNAVGKKAKLCDLEKLLNVTLLNGANPRP